eukprot:CAMPEP_0178726716 /NCGR_PEP_ID=MMETSP0699-20121125/27465_1 /TAXON_ID=265572 /ORGANISM="Extubocellulus spinifer, Strain CCMP396" /LENGTH=46 /DNA_ID= /DNA_START= /DNA_END= /DNA_ORIENTATION=
MAVAVTGCGGRGEGRMRLLVGCCSGCVDGHSKVTWPGIKRRAVARS